MASQFRQLQPAGPNVSICSEQEAGRVGKEEFAPFAGQFTVFRDAFSEGKLNIKVGILSTWSGSSCSRCCICCDTRSYERRAFPRPLAASHRITSYNVCYTKLLRGEMRRDKLLTLLYEYQQPNARWRGGAVDLVSEFGPPRVQFCIFSSSTEPSRKSSYNFV